MKQRASKQPAREATITLREPLAGIIIASFGVDDRLRLANQIVEETARKWEADIATLFRVEDGDKLVLKGGVVLVDGKRKKLPTKLFYTLDWEATSWEDPKLERKGVTAGVAVLNKELAIDSFKDLCRYSAHRGYWDDYIYRKDPADRDTGFGCLRAVPLRLSNTGEPKDIVVGVLKIERRCKRLPFDEVERAAFVIVADHLSQILRDSHQVKQVIALQVEQVLGNERSINRGELERRFRILSRYREKLERTNSSGSRGPDRRVVSDHLKEELPEAADWINAVAGEVTRALGHEPRGGQSIFPVLRKLRVVKPMHGADEAAKPPLNALLKAVDMGFAKLAVSKQSRDAALRNLKRWLVAPVFAIYRTQLERLIDEEQWAVLLDSFHRVLPFGTGGRRGPVGIGPNRFNPYTLQLSVQGHVEYLRERFPKRDLSVVIAYDVRAFHDLRGVYDLNRPNPLRGITSRDFAHFAAGVYAAWGIRVYMLPEPEDSPSYMSTPELSFAIRRLKANGGLNISASHNHPDDNGGKFFDAHGGQAVPPKDQEMVQHVERVEKVDQIASLDLADAREAGLLEVIPRKVHKAYIDLNLAQSLHPEARNASIVFTPLHGTGDATAGEVLRRARFQVHAVVEQLSPDGSFSAVPFRAPNPEVPESMQAGIDLASKVGADVVMACDPDADRIGVCSKTREGTYQFLSGNEIAVLVTHYKLESLRVQNRLPARPLVIKTEVTTELLRAITEDFGGTIIGDLLVGFKYHGNILDQIEKNGQFKNVRASLKDFVVAVEESHGVLVTPKLRDKDAAGAAILLAELAALQRAQGRTLIDYLDQIYLRYGYYANLVTSMVMTGAEGLSNIHTIQQFLRQRSPSSIAGWKVVETVDHQDPSGIHGQLKWETDRAARNVLVFRLENDARVTIRPSGTEPKNKTYVEVGSKPLGVRADSEGFRRRKAEVALVARRIADDFTHQMLEIIGVRLPNYALRISGLVPLDKRIEFGQDFLPGLEGRVRELYQSQTSEEEVSKWIDESLRTYGEDARGMVGEAVRAYLDAEREKTRQLDPTRAAERLKCLDSMNAVFFRP